MLWVERVRYKCIFSNYLSGMEGKTVLKDLAFQRFERRVALGYCSVIRCIINFIDKGINVSA